MTHHRVSGLRGPDWDWRAAHAVCLREARRVLGTDTLAEDAAQEAALRAWRYRERGGREPDRSEAWLGRIAQREALRLAARRRLEPLEGIDPSGPSHDDDVAQRVTIERALSGLASADRALLHAHYVDDLTCAQVAQRFGLPVGTVKVRLYRLRGRLRGVLADHDRDRQHR
jgi:RNA polymerase sigma-70 factor (ECF subfamily)